jgi:MFS family permease
MTLLEQHESTGTGEAGAAEESPRLGTSYWKLWSSSAVSTVGDGCYLSALPLIAATFTKDPIGIAAVSAAGTLPWLLFGLASGALVDRWDLRRVMWVTDLCRAAVAAVLAVLLVSGQGSIPILVAGAFILAAGETLYIPASQSIVPDIVSRKPQRLQLANSWLSGAQIICQDFVGRPLGGALFMFAPWLPVLVDAGSFASGSALVGSIRPRLISPAVRDSGRLTAQGLLSELVAGLRWLWRHQLLRTLALMVGADNFVYAAWSVLLVLLAEERFHLNGVGFGILSASLGIGGALGSAVATPISKRLSTAVVIVLAMIAEGLATLVVGVADYVVVVGLMLVLVGAAVAVWNVLTVSLRQAIVPRNMVGRVNSAYRILAIGMTPLGAVAGGVVSRLFGLPTLFVCSGIAVMGIALSSRFFFNGETLRQAIETTS